MKDPCIKVILTLFFTLKLRPLIISLSILLKWSSPLCICLYLSLPQNIYIKSHNYLFCKISSPVSLLRPELSERRNQSSHSMLNALYGSYVPSPDVVTKTEHNIVDEASLNSNTVLTLPLLIYNLSTPTKGQKKNFSVFKSVEAFGVWGLKRV